ncbi:MAG: hypothetical protein CVU41_05845 [Chloroflexi bacterium HGW-Chloroflexi-3]|nr:MAG: hypothetical protein CVU41_05845 [Chloroflexi bacterium HGW-Chloroflexi-3]
MTEILNFLIEFEIWFYVILGLISLIFFSRLFNAIGNWREAAFGLEHDIAQRKFRSALSILLLIFILFVGEFFFVTYSSSLLPDQSILATPTIDILASSSPTNPNVANIENNESLSPTLTAVEEGCMPGQIEWIFPEPASEIDDVVQLIGTVNVENFGFYKYEYTEPGNTFWKTIAGDNKIVIEDQIGLWNTSQIVPGDYLLRLVVLDNDNNEYPACIVSVRVINQ